jgi:hypothetical protein
VKGLGFREVQDVLDVVDGGVFSTSFFLSYTEKKSNTKNF